MARTKNFNETAVLDKAVQLFRRQGYNVTTPAELVAHLGISRSSLYDTYGDKHSLFIQSLQRYREVSTAHLNEIADTTGDVKVAIRKIFKQVLDECFEERMPRGCFLINAIVESTPEDTSTMEVVTASMKETKETFLKLVEKGQAAGQLPATRRADAMADYLTNCLSGISVSSRAGTDRKTCEAIVESSMAVLSIH